MGAYLASELNKFILPPTPGFLYLKRALGILTLDWGDTTGGGMLQVCGAYLDPIFVAMDATLTCSRVLAKVA